MMTGQFKNSNIQCLSYLRVTLRVCRKQNSFEVGGKAHSETEIPSPKDLKALMVHGEHQGYVCHLFFTSFTAIGTVITPHPTRITICWLSELYPAVDHNR